MRNMERLEELTHRPPRQLGVWLVAGVTALVVFAAIAGSLGDETASAEKDPLDTFGRAAQLAGLAPRVEGEPQPAPDVDRTSLVFPEVLTGAVLPPTSDFGADSRPEVESAIAAASAELEHPDPLFEPSSLRQKPLSENSLRQGDVPTPASAIITETPRTQKLALTAQIGTPTSASRAQTQQAGAGHDGLYTLQIVSYQSSAEANAFADELRARGHASFVMRADIDGRGTFYRVRVGPFESKHEAEQYRADFESREQMNTFVVKRRD